MQEKFDRLLKELLEWNKKFNLTAITDPEDVRLKHFEDSLTILQAVDLKDQKVADIGPGAGFPGIPLKIARPDISLTLIEATRKKVDFLEHLIKVLNLKKTRAIWGRAEDIARSKEYADKFDVALVRAVAKLDKLAGYCLPLVKPGGILIAMKGAQITEELKTAKKEIAHWGGRLKEVKKITLPNSNIVRCLVVIEKMTVL